MSFKKLTLLAVVASMLLLGVHGSAHALSSYLTAFTTKYQAAYQAQYPGQPQTSGLRQTRWKGRAGSCSVRCPARNSDERAGLALAHPPATTLIASAVTNPISSNRELETHCISLGLLVERNLIIRCHLI